MGDSKGNSDNYSKGFFKILADKIEEGSEEKFVTMGVKPDKRFPNTDKSTWCWALYNEWLLCAKKNGSDEEACPMERKKAKIICPEFWIDEWDEQREDGIFPGVKLDE